MQVLVPPILALLTGSVRDARGDRLPVLAVTLLSDKMLELLILVGAPRLPLL